MEILISGMAGLSIMLISIGLYLIYEEKRCADDPSTEL